MVISTIPDKSKNSKIGSKNQSMYSDLDRSKHLSFWKIFGWLFLLTIVGIVAGTATLVAATGIVNVPGFSNLVYATSPSPVRIVQPAVFDLGTAVKSLTVSKSGTMSVALSEQQLTSLVSASHLTAFREAQIIVDSTGLSFFGYFINVPFGNPVIIQTTLKPTLKKANTISCSVTKLSFGNLAVPAGVMTPLSNLACGQLESQLKVDGMNLTGITLSDQTLTLSYQPIVSSAAPTASLLP